MKIVEKLSKFEGLAVAINFDLLLRVLSEFVKFRFINN